MDFRLLQRQTEENLLLADITSIMFVPVNRDPREKSAPCHGCGPCGQTYRIFLSYLIFIWMVITMVNIMQNNVCSSFIERLCVQSLLTLGIRHGTICTLIIGASSPKRMKSSYSIIILSAIYDSSINETWLDPLNAETIFIP